MARTGNWEVCFDFCPTSAA